MSDRDFKSAIDAMGRVFAEYEKLEVKPMSDLDDESREYRDNLRIVQRVKNWRGMTDSDMRLHCGELSAQEIRAIRAVLKHIAPIR